MAATATGKKVLILGGSHAEIPLVRAAKALGLETVTLSGDTAGLAHKAAARTVIADYSDVAAVKKAATELKADFLCPGCNDFCILSAAEAAGDLKLPRLDDVKTTQAVHHKDGLRELALRLGIPSPLFRRFGEVEEAFSFLKTSRGTWIVKPIDLSGGKGVFVCDSKSVSRGDVEKALELSRARVIVAEEFVGGTLHSACIFIVDGKVAFRFFADEYCNPVNPFLVEGAHTSLVLEPAVRVEVERWAELLASELKLGNGVMHFQFIQREGKPHLLELCRRPPGDLYLDLVEQATGRNLAEDIVRSWMGPPWFKAFPKAQGEASWVIRHCLMAGKEGRLEGLEVAPELSGRIVSELLWGKPGDLIRDYRTYKMGIVIARFTGPDELRSKVSHINRLLRVKVTQVGQEDR